MNIYIIKGINLFKYLVLLKIDFFIKLFPGKINKNSLLLVRVDSIGDYILIRNYFRILKESKRFSGYRITLCGNMLWKELAETIDDKTIDEFIWLDRKKYSNSIMYKYKFLKNIYRKGFETAIDTTFSREILFSDAIIKASAATVRIGSTGSPDTYVKWKRNLFSNKIYTELIPAAPDNMFEFLRNKELMERIIGEKIIIIKPAIEVKTLPIAEPFNGKYAVLFMGASDEKRRWNVLNFADTAEYLVKEYNMKIILAGSATDKELSLMFKGYNVSENIIDMAGKTALSQLAVLISQSEILLSNETGAVHIAAAVDTPFVCISNGNHLGRFNPYPAEIFNKCLYAYPKEIRLHINNPGYIEGRYRFNSELDINAVEPGYVKLLLEKLLN